MNTPSMEQRIPPHIPELLDRLAQENALRALPDPASASKVDFTSNDYLGLARVEAEENDGEGKGATGSRLLSGNHPAHETLEAYCAELFQGDSALLFNSGYLANLGVLSCLPQRGDVLLYDERSHASIKDGLRLSLARRFSFKHNDLHDLERLLQQATGTAWIVAEALYSMDGDHPDLPAMVELAERHGAHIVLDEAHSTGLYGEGGSGLACHYGLQSRTLVRIHTFGKAAGRHGAVVVGPSAIRTYLLNRSRPFIYTTAMPPVACRSIQDSLERMKACDAERKALAELYRALVEGLGEGAQELWTPILPYLRPGNDRVKTLAENLRGQGFDLRAILSPTVAQGGERLRIVLHAYNTLSEVEALVKALRSADGL